MLPDIIRNKGSREVTVVLRELKARGAAYKILDTGGIDELQWRDEQGTTHTVLKKTVSNEVSRAVKALKASGLIPD